MRLAGKGNESYARIARGTDQVIDRKAGARRTIRRDIRYCH